MVLWMKLKNKSRYHFENSEFVDNCLEMVFSDGFGRSAFHDSFYFRLFVKILDIVFGVDH